MQPRPPQRRRPLHLGLTPWVGDLAAHAHDIARQAEAAEGLGYDSLWLPESHFLERGASPSPLLVLSAAAARTSTLKLGTTSYLLPVRHPIQVAEEIAVLDRISNGRVIVGLGRGFRRTLFDVFDVSIKEKRRLFESSLHKMVSAWAGEPINAEGDETVTLAPLCVQKPHPPLWVAAFGPKALTQAARLGLPYLASPVESFARLRSNYALHREQLAEHGREDADAVPVMRTVFASESSSLLEQARRALEIQAAEIRSARGSLRPLDLDHVDDWAIVGSPGEVAHKIAEQREVLGMTHLIVRGHIPRIRREDLEESLGLLVEAL